METPTKEVPTGAVFSITVPLDRKKTKLATFHLKEMDESLFIAARDVMAKNDFVATRMIIKNLWVGGDSVELLEGNFVATQSARLYVQQMLEPVEGELKKN